MYCKEVKPELMKVPCFLSLFLFLHNGSFSQDTRYTKESSQLSEIKYIEYNLERFSKSDLATKFSYLSEEPVHLLIESNSLQAYS